MLLNFTYVQNTFPIFNIKINCKEWQNVDMFEVYW